MQHNSGQAEYSRLQNHLIHRRAGFADRKYPHCRPVMDRAFVFAYAAADAELWAHKGSLELLCWSVPHLEVYCLESDRLGRGRTVDRIDYTLRSMRYSERVEYKQYNAVALFSVIDIPQNFHEKYFLEDIITPWSGVEEILRTMSLDTRAELGILRR